MTSKQFNYKLKPIDLFLIVVGCGPPERVLKIGQKRVNFLVDDAVILQILGASGQGLFHVVVHVVLPVFKVFADFLLVQWLSQVVFVYQFL